jgi:hypothetical protein
MSNIAQRRRRLMLAVLLACPVVAYLSLPHSADYTVTTRARKLAVVTDWLPIRLAGNAPYQWVSDHELIIQHATRPAGILDVSTGLERPLTALASMVSRQPDLATSSGGRPSDWCVSPNGQWLLTYAVVAGKPLWAVSTLDGAHVFDYPTTYPYLRDRRSHGPMAVWDGDSRGFIQIEAVRSNYAARHFTLPVALCTGQFAPVNPRLATAGRTMLLGGMPDNPDGMFYPLGETSAGAILMADLFTVHRGSTAIRLCSLGGEAPSDQLLPIPPDATIAEARLSPDGKRLAWIFDFSGRLYNPNLRRLPFTLPSPGHGAGEVWVSNVDGTAMHPIAIGNDYCIGPRFLTWTPDGKSVTFVYRRCLYSAPAE